MKTSAFLEQLKEHQGKALVFEYAPGKRVGANYHITEVKNIHIESVDCGGGTDSWKETLVQLWESPSEIGKTEYLSVYKAMGILKKVDRLRTMDKEAEIRFEYGNSEFHAAQLCVAGISAISGELVVHLHAIETDCKAKDSCGVPEPQATETCAPGSGCC